MLVSFPSCFTRLFQLCLHLEGQSSIEFLKRRLMEFLKEATVKIKLDILCPSWERRLLFKFHDRCISFFSVVLLTYLHNFILSAILYLLWLFSLLAFSEFVLFSFLWARGSVVFLLLLVFQNQVCSLVNFTTSFLSYRSILTLNLHNILDISLWFSI